MIFDYNAQKVFMQSLQVDDIGNAFLRCSSSKGFEYYFVSRTVLGKTMILKFGPVLPDMDIIGDNYELFVKKIDYKETAIKKEINLLINDPKKGIENVELVSLQDVEKSMLTLHEIFDVAANF